jgi:ABC-type uncharacterized transport system substrate-binding protein
MERREALCLLGGAALWPLAARAQAAEWVPKIGYLSPKAPDAANERAFWRSLRELGYRDGTNLVIESRYAAGRLDRLPRYAAELVRLDVDVIVAVVTKASLAARDATKTIPIVMMGVSDPVGSGLVASLARPGGNITGTSSMSAEVIGKALQVLKEALPGTAHVAVLWNPRNAVFQGQMLAAARRAAGVLGMRLSAYGVKGPAEFSGAFAAIGQAKPGALLVMPDPMLILNRARLLDLVRRSGLPAMYAARQMVTSGGLMSYGPDIRAQFRRAAVYVDKILKGAKPADLPVEQPTAFELLLNLKTARALGLSFPVSIVSRADEVIE